MSDLGPAPDPADLAILREGPGGSAAAKARVRARLGAVVPSMAAGGAVAAGMRAPGVAGSVTRTAAYTAALATFVAGGVLGAVLYAGLAPRATRVVFVDRAVPVVAENAAAPAPPEAPKAAPIAASPDAPASASAPQRAGPSQLSAERRILDEARGALLRGEAQPSLEALDRHRRSFAAPLLAEERDALQVQALVKAERYPDARSRADAFRRRYPDSFYLSMVDSAVASIP